MTGTDPFRFQDTLEVALRLLPATASRPRSSPAVSVGRTVSVITPKTGPASSSLTMRNVVAPVTSSPAQT